MLGGSFFFESSRCGHSPASNRYPVASAPIGIYSLDGVAATARQSPFSLSTVATISPSSPIVI